MKRTPALRGWTGARSSVCALVKAVAETGVRVPSMCLSAHRRFPLGSEDDAVRHQGTGDHA